MKRKNRFPKKYIFLTSAIVHFNQTKCLNNDKITKDQKYVICALAISVFLQNEISYFGNTNSVNIRTEPLNKLQVRYLPLFDTFGSSFTLPRISVQRKGKGSTNVFHILCKK